LIRDFIPEGVSFMILDKIKKILCSRQWRMALTLRQQTKSGKIEGSGIGYI